jgi:hypothetical protein
MTAANPDQPELELGDYRGQTIVSTRVRLANGNDGFDPSTQLEYPQIYDIGQRVTIAVDAVVVAHNPKATKDSLDEDEILIDLTQTFKCLTMAVVPRAAVEKELQAAFLVQADREKARKTAQKTARQAKGSGKVVPISDSLGDAGAKGGFDT